MGPRAFFLGKFIEIQIEITFDLEVLEGRATRRLKAQGAYFSIHLTT